MENFKELFRTYLDTKNQLIDWNKIKPPTQNMILPHSSLASKQDPKEAAALLNKLCVLKLNGGLGTTMGCTGPKSVIEVRYDQSFLDLTVKQIMSLNKKYGTDVPLLLMNSFNTHEETQKIVEKYENKVKILSFNQSRYPRVYKDTLLPMPENHEGQKSDWFPPGHGDLYFAFYNSGLLEELIKQGKEYVFISNIDNLGGTVDFDILNHMLSSTSEFVMEVTDKTRADIKGGTLIDYEGKVKLLEIAQVPSSKVEEFKSIKKFKIFNTNNLWAKLSSIKRIVEDGSLRGMDVIINNKVANGKAIIQLERAAGAAIEYFKEAIGVNVSRSRFLPVKSTSDLFVVQSNLYTLEEGTLTISPKRAAAFPTVPVPVVKLGEHFTKVSDFLDRFRDIPDILELEHLTVSGDVTFGSKVVMRGTVIVVANPGSRIDIPSGSVFENKVVSGNVRILEH